MLKKLTSLFVSICLIISFSIPVFAQESQPSNNENAIAGQLIVSIENTSSISAKGIENNNENFAKSLNTSIFEVKDALLESTGIENSNNVRIQSNEPTLRDIVLEKMGHVYLVEYPSNQYSFNEAKAKLNNELKKSGYQVKSIEPNYIMQATDIQATADVSISSVHLFQQWQYNMINVPNAWTINTGSSSAKIAVLDTGADYNHVSLKDFINTSLAKNFTEGDPKDVMDRQNHGTHVAGTIASYGSVSGVMQEASLIPIKVLGDNGKGPIYGIAQGVLYAASIDADVINMSLGGGGYSSTFDQACQSATEAGTVIVCASGNESSSSISYPAAYDSCIAVGALTANKTRASFSNYGEGLDVMAPGSNIYSTLPSDKYGFMSGTSMASPHVAGVVGLLRCVNPNATVAQIRNVLTSTAQSAGDKFQYGFGIVDTYAAVRAIGGTPIEKVATPSFNPNGGNFTAPVSVSISCATAGATIRYTTDGSEPTANSTVYNSPIIVSKTTTMKAKAFQEGMNDSAVASTTYVIESGDSTYPIWTSGTAYQKGDRVSYNGKTYECLQPHTALKGWEPTNVPALWTLKEGTTPPIQTVATPTFNPNGGSFTAPVSVSISCSTAGATIRYTTDGSNPTASSPIYSSPINVTKTTTIKAKALREGMNDSAIASATYTIGSEPIQTVATPTFNPNGGSFTAPISVTISCSTAGSTIRYTTDGSNPTASSPIYSSPINVTKTTTIKAKALKEGMNDSAVASATYTIGNTTIEEWQEYKAYKVGDVVSYKGVNYKCVQPHTSLPGWEPINVPALWQKYTVATAKK